MEKVVKNIKFDDIKRFIMFEEYYQNMVSIDLDNSILKLLNDIMDYHYDKIFGKEYIDKSSDVVDIKFQCIYTFDK